MLSSCQLPDRSVPEYDSFEDFPIYKKSDLGLSYTPEESVFRIWAPTAQAVRLHLYKSDEPEQAAFATHEFKYEDQGCWTIRLSEDLKGIYYTIQAKVADQWLLEVPDIYARAVGANGERGMIVDLKNTNPDDWESDTRPPLNQSTDIILYELHIRDLSLHPASGIQHKGKFLGLTETGTKTPAGTKTGLDHIKELGVTHIHLLPSFDFLSIDERQPERAAFNWGYDPQNYNVPEGSYATDASDGRVRIREFKTLVKTLHDHGLRVIMDVVYNHTGATETSGFNQLVPGYYYRHTPDGQFSNASGCGNETASERAMMRKFIIESVKHWVTEYHVDGFRFDLMGIHDIETMNLISEELHRIDPTIFVYGEGWTAGDSPLPVERQALKRHTPQLNRIAAFSDDLRDGVKGSVFEAADRGFASGKSGMEETIKFGVAAATPHPQVNFSAVNYSDAPWANEPYQCINYVACHDNHTLWDRLVNSMSESSEKEKISMHRLANTIVLTSQGIPFLHAGAELLRTKGGEENSYQSPDEVNRIDWTRKEKYPEVFDYYRDLIRLRKNHPAFRMSSTEMIARHLHFFDALPSNVLGFQLKGHANGDVWQDILVFYNGNDTAQTVRLPAGNWTLVLDGKRIEETGLGSVKRAKITLSAYSALIMKK